MKEKKSKLWYINNIGFLIIIFLSCIGYLVGKAGIVQLGILYVLSIIFAEIRFANQ